MSHNLLIGSLLWLVALAACGEGVTLSGGELVGADASGMPDGAAETLAPDLVGGDLDGLRARALLSVAPPGGAVHGGELVVLSGRGFAPGLRIWFGAQEVVGLSIVGPAYAEARSPAGPEGDVDVVARWPDGEEHVLVAGYRYEARLRVFSLSPAEGSTDGGTPVVITGEGFAPGTRFVLGGEQALQVRVVDERTLLGLSPRVREPGPVSLVVGGPSGGDSLAKAFVYHAPPRLREVLPPVGPSEGGDLAELLGQGFAPDSKVFFGDDQATVLGVEDGRVLVEVPAGAPGVVDVVVTGARGLCRLPDGYGYARPGAAQRSLAIAALLPPEGPAAGGQPLAVLVEGLAGATAEDIELRIGGAAATLLAVGDTWLRVLSPAGAPGPADVSLTVGEAIALLSEGYRYFPDLALFDASPHEGTVEGGTTLVIEGTGFLAGLDELRVGALAGTNLEILDDARLLVDSPPGAPGLVDIVARRAGAEAVLTEGFAYEDDEPALFAVVPAEGSVAGGTRVVLYGAGFSAYTTLRFGELPIAGFERVDDGTIVLTTPRHPAGPVDVRVVRRGTEVVLAGGFTYFEPESGNGGTSGPPLDETLNVVVLDALSMAPVAGAYVVVGSARPPRHAGTTDNAGRITFSGADLLGPQELSASREDYSAATIVSFDAQNATLLLFPDNPPSSGGGSATVMAPGLVSGAVVWDDKFRVLPYGDCRQRPNLGLLCQPCEADEDCAPGGRCTRIEQTGRFCTTPCGEQPDGRHLDCPPDYACSLMDTKGYQCVPTAGEIRIRCGTTDSYAGAPGVNPGAGAFVGPDMRYHIETRLETLAVLCVAYQMPDQPFAPGDPFLMGLRRRVQPISGEALADQDVVLNIPLRGAVRVRLDDPPDHPLGDDRWTVRGFVDLGGEGTFPLQRGAYGGRGEDTYLLERTPSSLDGPLDGASLLVSVTQAHAGSAASHGHALRSGVTELGAAEVLVHDARGWRREPVGAPFDAYALAVTPEGGLFLAGAGGFAARREGGLWYQEAMPTKARLTDLCVDAAGEPWAAGLDGVLVRRQAERWQLVPAAPGYDFAAIACAPGGAVFAAGDRGALYRLDESGAHERVALDTEGALGALWLDGDEDLWVGGEAGLVRHWRAGALLAEDLPSTSGVTVLHRAAGGALLAMTDTGEVWRHEAAGWQREESGHRGALYDAVTLPSGELLAVGDDGAVLRRDDQGQWSFEGLAGFRGDLRAVAVGAAGELFATGLPNVLISPLMGVARLLTPVLGEDLGGRLIEWWAPTGVTPSIQYVSIASQWGYPVWDVFVAGELSTVRLPDFDQLAGFDPVGGRKLVLTLTRIHYPPLDIDHFSAYDLWQGGYWNAWSATELELSPAQ